MSDQVYRQAAIDAVDSETVSTNPEHFKSSEKFIKFMDDAERASFGKWQWANGFNTAVVAAKIQIKKLPSAQPEIIRCRDCKHWVTGYITDADDFIPPKCGKYQQMVGPSSDDYCNLAERREE